MLQYVQYYVNHVRARKIIRIHFMPVV